MNKIAFISIALVSAVGLNSCDLYNKVFSKDGSSGKVKKEVVLPQDREAIHQTANQTTYSPEEFAKGVIKGDWAIEEVYGEKAVGEKAPFLKFSDADHRVYGNNGCNTVNAVYEYDAADHSLKFSEIAVTMMLCHKEGITDIQINRALDATDGYELEQTEDGYLLYLKSGDETVMTLMHQNFDFLNGTWKVTAIGDDAVNIEKMKLVFDVDEHKIHGNTGCNVLNGRLETDMDAPNSISFEAIAVTMMMCPEMEYQTALLVALEDACRARPVEKNKVVLLDSNNQPVVTLVRTSDK